jgi:hypothetical protein
MLFRKKKEMVAATEAKKSEFAGVPWDENTLNWVVKQKSFDVKINHVSLTRGVGADYHGNRLQVRNPYQISGLILWPKYIVVEFEFGEQEDFGSFTYDSFEHRITVQENGRGKWLDVHVPVLRFFLSGKSDIGRMIFEAHRDSVLCGRTNSVVRLWKREGEGGMSSEDKEKGWSYNSRYGVLGCYVWNELQSKELPRWAVPRFDDRFSLDDMPEPCDLDYMLK